METVKGNWKSHVVRHMNGAAGERRLEALEQLASASWNRLLYGPAIIYMPEKDRLMMTVHSEGRIKAPQSTFISFSDDHGATWSELKYFYINEEGIPDGGHGIVPAYLGGGRCMLQTGYNDGRSSVWFSDDFGETWGDCAEWPYAPNGKTFYTWCTPMIDKDPVTGTIERIMVGGYYEHNGVSRGGFQISEDEGRTWSVVEVPEWIGFNEIAVARAANGDLVAALRSDGPKKYRAAFDHVSGMGVSISTDNGYTWSDVDMIYNWGRHHSSLVVLPDGEIIMSYVVRLGYANTPEGFPQWGIEAVSSRDNGRTWDLDHKYILRDWQGTHKGPNAWVAGSQQTSSLMLPDGSLLTAFGTGIGADPAGSPLCRTAMNVGLVMWKPDSQGSTDDCRNISSAHYTSDLRNNFDPHPEVSKERSAGIEGYPNLALRENGTTVRTSETDSDISAILFSRYPKPPVVLETLPAWVELSWPTPQNIREIRIRGGLPGLVDYKNPKTECSPTDYRLQYFKNGEWIDLVPPVTNATRYADTKRAQGEYLLREEEIEYVHTFEPVVTDAVRIYVTRSSDEGKRAGSNGKAVVPEHKRKTIIRQIDVLG